MTTSFNREQLLEAAMASPAAVAAHDREAWTGLFATDYSVEDPVGSRPHVPGSKGRKPVERFFDTFIAPNDIIFNVDRDIVNGDVVLRDLSIEIHMAAGAVASVPMHVTYEMIEENGALRIIRLRAHWELSPMVKQVLGKGWRGIWAFSLLGCRMMRIQGFGGALGFSRGFRGIHRRGKRMVEQFVETLDQRDSERLTGLFSEKNEGICFPADEEPVSPEFFMEQFKDRLSLAKVLAAGYFVSFSYSTGESRGAGIFEFNPEDKKIQKALFYFE